MSRSSCPLCPVAQDCKCFLRPPSLPVPLVSAEPSFARRIISVYRSCLLVSAVGSSFRENVPRLTPARGALRHPDRYRSISTSAPPEAARSYSPTLEDRFIARCICRRKTTPMCSFAPSWRNVRTGAQSLFWRRIPSPKFLVAHVARPLYSRFRSPFFRYYPFLFVVSPFFSWFTFFLSCLPPLIPRFPRDILQSRFTFFRIRVPLSKSAKERSPATRPRETSGVTVSIALSIWRWVVRQGLRFGATVYKGDPLFVAPPPFLPRRNTIPQNKWAGEAILGALPKCGRAQYFQKEQPEAGRRPAAGPTEGYTLGD